MMTVVAALAFDKITALTLFHKKISCNLKWIEKIFEITFRVDFNLPQ